MTKKIIKSGETIKIPMQMMDNANLNTVDVLQTRLTDAKVAYAADMNGSTLNDLQAAERALTDARSAQAPIVTDTARSDDYKAGTRDHMAITVENAWRR